jgi:ribosomal protein L18E
VTICAKRVGGGWRIGVASSKLRKGGCDVGNIEETFRWNPAGSNPAP